MAPPRPTVPRRGAHRAAARSVSLLVRAVAVLAVLVVLATLFLDVLLIAVGLLTPAVAAVVRLRRWLGRLAAQPARAAPAAGH
ncbi:hypothetical protein [Micromonospora thermarum]|uniref:Uncharacterized protein n=1 Tax=Micromonospora thermarum TaxID=2720024 RepID=A0ABX0ZAF3_9ACTN|nr:hypothetical protein [Micromonospora thermarum]NJP34468.1 hypothetical protein [Micromonospora thermarum]